MPHCRLGRPTRLDRLSVAGWLPGGDDTHATIARQVQQLMRRRWDQPTRCYATQTAPPPWPSALGYRPADARGGARWVAAVTAVAEYRERYELPYHIRCSVSGQRSAP